MSILKKSSLSPHNSLSLTDGRRRNCKGRRNPPREAHFSAVLRVWDARQGPKPSRDRPLASTETNVTGEAPRQVTRNSLVLMGLVHRYSITVSIVGGEVTNVYQQGPNHAPRPTPLHLPPPTPSLPHCPRIEPVPNHHTGTSRVGLWVWVRFTSFWRPLSSAWPGEGWSRRSRSSSQTPAHVFENVCASNERR